MSEFNEIFKCPIPDICEDYERSKLGIPEVVTREEVIKMAEALIRKQDNSLEVSLCATYNSNCSMLKSILDNQINRLPSKN